MLGKTFDQLKIGDKAERSRTITKEHVKLFAEITGDTNPAHLDEEYAAKTVFKKPIAHGILVSGLISSVIGNDLPGEGTIYIYQDLKFLAPVYMNDTITTIVEVVEMAAEKKRVTLKTCCFNQDKVCVIEGKAITSPPRIKNS